MTDTKFTKGPYDIIQTDFPDENDIVSFATIPGVAVAQHVSDDNSPLFSAAPDLYESTKSLLDLVYALSERAHSNPDVIAAEKAIAKARGENDMG